MNVKKLRCVAVALMLLMVVTTTLCACVNTNDGTDIIDDMSVDLTVSSKVIESSEEEIPTPEGYTATPTVVQTVNITPNTVAICGNCEEGSTVYVTGGVEDVQCNSVYDYYIIFTELKYDGNNLLKISASVDGKETSLEREYVASYKATAGERLDGNSVSVGVDSRLYFDKMVEGASGTNLYTASELKSIRDYVADVVTGYYNDRAGVQDVELIYVLLPDCTTIYPEVFPEGVVKPSNTTVYDQVLSAIKQTRASVIDLREVFLAVKDLEVTAEYGGLYRTTDSALTDYGAFLAYTEIMNHIATRFPEAAPHTIDEFEWKQVTALGGNLAMYRDLDIELITEQINVAVPKFSMNYGTNGSGLTSITALRKYVDKENGNYNFFTTVDGTDNINGISERWLIDTKRVETGANLPSALIHHDYGSLSFLDLLAERMEKTMIAKSEDFAVNLSNAIQYAVEGDNVVDYIIVIISEENMDEAFGLAFAG